MKTIQTQHGETTLKEYIKIYLDYVMAVAESKSRWEELTRIEGDEE
jgi:hypothetical protein|tara:strand:- start:3 stop:140 length:138 start_codon:yes stop_codon:yes gene_type:complete